jgi:hypothetical protein
MPPVLNAGLPDIARVQPGAAVPTCFCSAASDDNISS